MEYSNRIRRMDVILIDPNKVSRGNLGALVRDFGCYSVRPFDDSETPIVSIINKPPSVVLCHWGEDGEFAKKILNVIRHHGSDAVARTPFVLVARNLDRKIISAGLKIGATQFLSDPVVPADLMDKLAFVLCDNRQMLRQSGKLVYIAPPTRSIKKPIKAVNVMEFPASTSKAKTKPVTARPAVQKGALPSKDDQSSNDIDDHDGGDADDDVLEL